MRGDVTQSSFAFTVSEYSWAKSEKYGDNSMHVVRKIDRLLDVSPVTYPAYEDTLAEARSILDTKPKKENESDLINIIKLKHK
jgi:phage head maturation protease